MSKIHSFFRSMPTCLFFFVYSEFQMHILTKFAVSPYPMSIAIDSSTVLNLFLFQNHFSVLVARISGSCLAFPFSGANVDS